MRTASLRHKIILEHRMISFNSYGEENDEWQTYQEAYCAIEPMRGSEAFVSKQLYHKNTLKLKMRFISGVTTHMRIKCNERIFEILEIVNPYERNKELILTCSEVV